jgi:hypothetical protein
LARACLGKTFAFIYNFSLKQMASQKDALSTPAAAIFVPIAVKLRAIPAAAAAQNNKNKNNKKRHTLFLLKYYSYVCPEPVLGNW